MADPSGQGPLEIRTGTIRFDSPDLERHRVAWLRMGRFQLRVRVFVHGRNENIPGRVSCFDFRRWAPRFTGRAITRARGAPVVDGTARQPPGRAGSGTVAVDRGPPRHTSFPQR